jgi:hypothetical protein
MGVIYQQECFEDLMGELPELFHAHYKEFEDKSLPLNVDWVKFVKLNIRGVLNIITARENESLIGYIFTYVQTTTHHAETLLAATDLIYVKPRNSRGIVLRRLIKETEKMCRDLGAKKLYIVVKAGSPTAKLLRAMKFELTEETYSCPL